MTDAQRVVGSLPLLALLELKGNVKGFLSHLLQNYLNLNLCRIGNFSYRKNTGYSRKIWPRKDRTVIETDLYDHLKYFVHFSPSCTSHSKAPKESIFNTKINIV